MPSQSASDLAMGRLRAVAAPFLDDMSDTMLQACVESVIDDSGLREADVEALVNRSLLARITDLERRLAIESSRAETFAGQVSEAKDTAYKAERCMDVMREAACRIKPMIRNGNLDGVAETAQHIMAARPEGWRPGG